MTNLDGIDRKILHALQEDGRIPNAELAEKVSLSPSPCWRRVKRLEDAGVIRKYVSLLDPKVLGLGVNVFVRVNVESHREEHANAFEEAVRDRPEIMECYRMSGGTDYLLRITTSDIASYDHLLSKVLMHLPGVSSVDSGFALHQVKYSTALPIG